MTINDSIGTGVAGLNRAQEVSSGTTTSKSRRMGASQGDQVSISNLSSALSAQQGESPFHAAKVAQLTAAVASGGYKVDSEALSSNIISSSTRS